MTVRTRFAPSPTGALHLGNVRAAVFNWLFARHHGGAFVLRLEDTDVERNVAGAAEALMADLRWLGVVWDEGPDVGGPHAPYRQSERGKDHDAAIRRLVGEGRAYPCFCDGDDGSGAAAPGDPGYRRYDGRCRTLDPDEAARRVAAGEPHVIRLASPTEGEVAAEDAVRGRITVPASDVDDFVLRRRDGRATYNFAVVVDDVAMEITHVIRGAGHLSNTPRQGLLFDALGAPRPVFAHLPQVLDPEGGKLSKRSGATSVAEYRRAGHLPEALVNYLSLLGWSHPDEEEILDAEGLTSAVSLDRIGAADTSFDPEKLRWVGQQHLARLSLDEVMAGVAPFLDGPASPVGDWPDARRRILVEALRSRLGTFGEITDHLPHFAPTSARLDAGHRELAGIDGAGTVLQSFRRRMEDPDIAWTPASLKGIVTEVGRETGARGPGLYHPLRLAVSGNRSGPDLGAILAATGRKTVRERLRRALDALGEV
jgi:glutamyl-tRNA synthetase